MTSDTTVSENSASGSGDVPGGPPAKTLSMPTFRALYGLAFLWELVVIVRHGPLLFGLSASNPLVSDSRAVGFFFILSGFLLTLRHSAVPWREMPRFLVRRLSRIWPLHMLVLLGLVAAFPDLRELLFTPQGQRSFLTHVALVHTWLLRPGMAYTFSPPVWCLSVFFFFYLVFPVIRYRFERRWAVWLGASLLVLAAVAAFCHWAHPGGQMSPRWPSTTEVFYTHPLARLPEFVLGMALALWYERTAAGYGRWGVATCTVVEVLAVAAVVLSRVFAWGISQGPVLAWLGDAGATYFYDVGCSVMPMGALVFFFAHERGYVGRFVGNRFCAAAGTFAFTIFIVHYPVIRFFNGAAPCFATVWLPIRIAMVVLVLGVLVYLLGCLVETPLRRAILARLAGRPAEARAFPRRGVAWASAVLVVVLSFVGYRVLWYPPLQRITAGEAAALAATASVRNVVFGSRLMLRSVNFTYQPDALEIIFVWENLEPLRLDHHVGVHCLDDRGGLRHQGDLAQDAYRQRWLPAHTLWQDRIALPRDQIRGTRSVGLVVYKPETDALPVANTPSDMGGIRFLVPLPKAVEAPGG